MQKYVFVLNGDGNPLSPCHPAVARKLLRKGRATMERVVPFTIRLIETKLNPIVQPVAWSPGLPAANMKRAVLDETPKMAEERQPSRLAISLA